VKREGSKVLQYPPGEIAETKGAMQPFQKQKEEKRKKNANQKNKK